MIGTMYHLLSKEQASTSNKLPQKLKSTAMHKKSTERNLSQLKLHDDEQLISLDFVILFTNVPVDEAIDYRAELLFEQEDVLQLLSDYFCYNFAIGHHMYSCCSKLWEFQTI